MNHKKITKYSCWIIISIVSIVGITTIIQGLHESKHTKDIDWSETCFVGYSKEFNSFAWTRGEITKSIFELEFSAYLLSIITFFIIAGSFIYFFILRGDCR